MKYEEYLELRKRRHWLKSQENWHGHRDGNWHRNQANYYRRIGKKVFNGVGFSDIIRFALRFHAPKIAENMSANNALFNSVLGRK